VTNSIITPTYISQIIVSGAGDQTSDGTYTRESGGETSFTCVNGNYIWFAADTTWFLRDVTRTEDTYVNEYSLDQSSWAVNNAASPVLPSVVYTYSNGTPYNAVTAWADQSGNGKNMTSDIAPTFVSNAKNGKPALAFSGNRMTGPGIFTGSLSRTLFVVYYTDNVNQVSNTICGQNNLSASDAGTFFMMQARNDGLNSSPYFAGYSQDLYGTPYENNVWKIASVDYENGSGATNLYWNADNSNSETLTLDTYNSGNCFTIGCFYDLAYSDYAEFFSGKLCEIIAYNRVLTNTERQQVEAYLMDKYAICLDTTSRVLMTGWVAGPRTLTPIGYAPYGNETYTYGDEVVRYETGVWIYANSGLGEIARAYSTASRPWLATWPAGFTAQKICS
jgi:hypothetical protein